MAYPGSDVTSRLQMPSSSTRPDPDAALVPQLGSDLSPATLRRVARLERADSPRTAASSAPADDAVSRQARSLIAGPGSFPQSLPLLTLRATGCVAVAEVHGPSLALELVDQLVLDGYHLVGYPFHCPIPVGSTGAEAGPALPRVVCGATRLVPGRRGVHGLP